MNDPAVGALSSIYLFVILFLVVLAILWFLLPFAIFGTKAKLDALISEVRRTNAELKKLRTQLDSSSKSSSSSQTEDMQEHSLTHDQLMAKYKISNDGEKYIFRGYRYDKIEDAVAIASKQASE